MSKTQKQPRLVLIEWEDSGVGFQGWKDVNSVSGTLSKCRSVGYLVKETKDCKVIFPHLDSEPTDVNLHGAGDMTIPCSAITKVIELVPKRRG